MQSLGLDRLTLDERLVLVHEIWDSIADEVGKRPLSDAERDELSRRLDAHESAPETAIDWETVKADILNSLKK